MLYKLWMVEDINKGHFEKAAKEMTYVDDWAFDASDVRAFVELEKAIQFINYADSIGVAKELVDSMRLYTNDECFLFGEFYHNTGDFQKAQTSAYITVLLMKQVYGELHPIYATALNNLGLEHLMLNDVVAAEHYFLHAAEIRHAILPPNDPDYALTLRNLGDAYFGMGDHEKAEKYYLQAYDIYQSYEAPSDEQLIYLFQLLNNMGNLNLQRKAYQSAEEYYLRAREIYDSHSGPIWDAELINNGGLQMGLGDVCLQRTGDYDRTATYYFKALKIYEQINAPLYLRTKTLRKLGQLYCDLKDYEQAEKYFKLVLVLHSDSLVKDRVDYTVTMAGIGSLYLKTGDYAQAQTYFKKCYDIFSTEYIKATNFFPERQRVSYWDLMKDWFEIDYPVLSYRAHETNDSLAGFAYNNELFKKGLLLSSSEAVKRSVLESSDTTLIRQWDDLMAKKQQIIALEEKNPYAANLASLREETEQLEKQITRSSAAYRENMRQWSITWDSVRATLQPNQVAIEYMCAPLNQDSTMYCALLLRHDSKHPQIIPLFEQQQVAALLHSSRGDSIAINTTYLSCRNGQQLTQLIWGPVKPYIHEGEQIFIAPTHMLHQIAIEHLPFDSAHAMSDVYRITRLSSTRELAMPKTTIPYRKATLYGGIEYEELDDEIMKYNHQLYASRSVTESPSNIRGRLTNIYAPPLKGTQREVDAIAPILKNQNIYVTIYSHFSACEESVKALSGQKQNILHFATHGMYVDTLKTDEPLERSILVFAGANKALRGDDVGEGLDDGVLTAKEISVLDFRDADIVVLSACETALGDVSGEGVFGLQRAFKMAGAQTILMALWQVSDDATRMLMTAFYRHYSKGLSKREAFLLAQKEVRNHWEERTIRQFIMPSDEEMREDPCKIIAPQVVTQKVTIQPYKSPYFWAGFILLD